MRLRPGKRDLLVTAWKAERRKKAKGASKNEKSFDNRCAALVSRERRAPRAGGERKSFALKCLEWTDCPQAARGAQVSRAARRVIGNLPRGASQPLTSCAALQATCPAQRRGLSRATSRDPSAVLRTGATSAKMPKMLHFVAFCCITLHGGNVSDGEQKRRPGWE